VNRQPRREEALAHEASRRHLLLDNRAERLAAERAVASMGGAARKSG
jgi:hypothetical protein